MGVLCSVIQALVLSVLDRGHDLTLCGAVAGQLVRDQEARCPHLRLQQVLAQQALGGLLVPSALHENVEHEDVLIDRSPEPMLLAGDRHHDLASRAGEPHPHALPKLYVR
jgi:hypothetical protein